MTVEGREVCGQLSQSSQTPVGSFLLHRIADQSEMSLHAQLRGPDPDSQPSTPYSRYGFRKCLSTSLANGVECKSGLRPVRLHVS
jgi:hypothetical protein